MDNKTSDITVDDMFEELTKDNDRLAQCQTELNFFFKQQKTSFHSMNFLFENICHSIQVIGQKFCFGSNYGVNVEPALKVLIIKHYLAVENILTEW